jgi:UDP-N-acetylglucosamine/UDP-N-acetylgalactosamine diphosphorylase
MEMADSILLHNLDVLKDDLKREYTELGVTLNYLFRVSELGKTLSVDMPIHKVKKNVKRYYKNGRYEESSELNAYKYETLALDLIHMMDSCLAFEIEREKEFAPIKNKEGKDLLDTARELLQMNGWEL